jgi:hypothetical protein
MIMAVPGFFFFGRKQPEGGERRTQRLHLKARKLVRKEVSYATPG